MDEESIRYRQDMRIRREISSEPIGEAYRSLIRFCGAHSRTCGFVFRGLDVPHCQLFAEERSLIDARFRVTSDWPGTRLVGHSAVIMEFDAQAGSVFAEHASPGLYSWIAPTLPEDLHFVREDGSILLASCAHERFAFL